MSALAAALSLRALYVAGDRSASLYEIGWEYDENCSPYHQFTYRQPSKTVSRVAGARCTKPALPPASITFLPEMYAPSLSFEQPSRFIP